MCQTPGWPISETVGRPSLFLGTFGMAYMAVTGSRSGTEVMRRPVLGGYFKGNFFLSLRGERCAVFFLFVLFRFLLFCFVGPVKSQVVECYRDTGLMHHWLHFSRVLQPISGQCHWLWTTSMRLFSNQPLFQDNNAKNPELIHVLGHCRNVMRYIYNMPI